MSLKTAALLFFTLSPTYAFSQTSLSVETAQSWQTKNDQRISGKEGDKFSVADLDDGPFLTYRVYLAQRWGERHELRGLYAPLSIHAKGAFDTPVRFIDSTFAANTPTTVNYTFNSYRLTYAYHFASHGDFRWAAGFTGKIRDAVVRVRQNGLDQKKANVGFVPLAHIRANYAFARDWSFDLDFDGLAAPQGRAIDLGLFIRHHWPNRRFSVYAGYRAVEGGADNDKVYNAALFESATLGFEFGGGPRN